MAVCRGCADRFTIEDDREPAALLIARLLLLEQLVGDLVEGFLAIALEGECYNPLLTCTSLVQTNPANTFCSDAIAA